jgi:hypothetical protein
MVWQRQQRYRRAEAYFRIAIKTCQKAYGRKHFTVASRLISRTFCAASLDCVSGSLISRSTIARLIASSALAGRVEVDYA